MNLAAQPNFIDRKGGGAHDRPRALRIDRFCELYGIGKTSAFRLIREGKVKAVKIAGRTLVTADSAEALLQNAEDA